MINPHSHLHTHHDQTQQRNDQTQQRSAAAQQQKNVGHSHVGSSLCFWPALLLRRGGCEVSWPSESLFGETSRSSLIMAKRRAAPASRVNGHVVSRHGAHIPRQMLSRLRPWSPGPTQATRRDHHQRCTAVAGHGHLSTQQPKPNQATSEAPLANHGHPHPGWLVVVPFDGASTPHQSNVRGNYYAQSVRSLFLFSMVSVAWW